MGQPSAGEDSSTTSARRRPIKSRCNMVHSLEDLRSWLFWRAVLAEALGTFVLVFLGCGSATGWNEEGHVYPPSVVQISFAFGLTLACLIWAIGGVSGCHVNPAVTIPMVITRKISIIKGLLYTLAQCVGGIAAAGLMMGVTPEASRGTLGASRLAPGMTAAQGFAVEFVLAFLLVFTVFGMVDKYRDQEPFAAIGIGFAAVTTHLMGIRFTGCNINPARTLGPSIMANVWENQWVYWCGPLLGGIAAGMVYDNLFSANASLRKTRDYLLAADYDNDHYEEQKERYITVDNKDDDVEHTM